MIARRLLISAIGVAIAASAALAQPAKVYRMAMLDASFAVDDLRAGGIPRYDAFFAELRRLGYVEGANLDIERLSGRGLPETAWADLARVAIAWGPDIIFATPSRMALQVKALTTTIPVVFVGGNPLGGGLVPSLARPGGNVTGFATDAGGDFSLKPMQLLLDVVPSAQRLGILGRPDWWAGPFGDAYRDGARRLGIAVVPVLVEGAIDEASLERAFETLDDDPVPALVIGNLSEFIPLAPTIARLALAAELPAISGQNLLAEAGLLMSYGPNFPDIFRRAAGYVGQILGGANPAEMPIQQPIALDFIVNLRTVEALGLTLPPEVTLLATEFIE